MSDQKSTEISGAKKKPSIAYMRDKEREKVKGIFRFYEVPGGNMKFAYRKYKGDPIETYDLLDGETYSIPLGVARHLNKNGWYPKHSYMLDEGGNPIMRVGEKVQRFGFQSLEFVDIEDMEEGGSPIVSVEATGK